MYMKIWENIKLIQRFRLLKLTRIDRIKLYTTKLFLKKLFYVSLADMMDWRGERFRAKVLAQM